MKNGIYKTDVFFCSGNTAPAIDQPPPVAATTTDSRLDNPEIPASINGDTPRGQLMIAARSPVRRSAIRRLLNHWMDTNLDECVIYKTITDFYLTQLEISLYGNNNPADVDMDNRLYDVNRYVVNRTVRDTILEVLPKEITDDFRYCIGIMEEAFPWMIEYKPKERITSSHSQYSGITPTTVIRSTTHRGKDTSQGCSLLYYCNILTQNNMFII